MMDIYEGKITPKRERATSGISFGPSWLQSWDWAIGERPTPKESPQPKAWPSRRGSKDREETYTEKLIRKEKEKEKDAVSLSRTHYSRYEPGRS